MTGGDPGRPGNGGSRGSQGGNAGWIIFGYLISGMVVYGAVGWVVSHWTHTAILFPVGMLFGLGAGVALTVYKYGRS